MSMSDATTPKPGKGRAVRDEETPQRWLLCAQAEEGGNDMNEQAPQYGPPSPSGEDWTREHLKATEAENRLLRRHKLELQSKVAQLGAEVERLRREAKP